MPLVAKGGGPWLLAGSIIAAAATGLALVGPWAWSLAAAAWGTLAFLAWFFRDPGRMVAPELCSPADGKVVRMDAVEDPDLGPCDRLSIFMSPLDVHVNRYPVSGVVASVRHHPGAHIPAFDKDSDRNERVVTRIQRPDGVHAVKVIQIAGAVARRIVPYGAPGDTAVCGARMGMIRLGSRCDLLVPQGRAAWTVRIGDQVHAGSSHVATWRDA